MPAVRALGTLEGPLEGDVAREVGRCAICLADLESGELVVHLPCHRTHVFHLRCLRPAMGEHAWQSSCPLCRAPIFLAARPQLAAGPSLPPLVPSPPPLPPAPVAPPRDPATLAPAAPQLPSHTGTRAGLVVATAGALLAR
eukprot:281638-Prorocentrum_minimum.AAC.1